MARDLKIEDEVQFLGGLDDSSRLIASADLLIHPAREENTGTVIVEALASGVPVIVTENCGFSHYVRDTGGGEVISNSDSTLEIQRELNNKLLRFLNDKDFRQTCRNNAKKFSLSHRVKNMKDVVVDLNGKFIPNI